MAKAQGQVTKIYKLSTLGFDVVDKQLTAITKNFEKIKAAKRSAEGKLLNTSDTDEIKKFSDEIAKLKIQEQQLRVERQKMINEQKAANIARQEEIRLQKAKQAGNLAEAGSIAQIRLQIRELNAALILKNQKGTGTIDFRGEILSIDQAVAKLKELTAAEQEFRRQFQKDGTLVAEYTTGIVQAFKRMGLDDLVGGQITRTKDRLNSLNTDFDRLQKELKETRDAGQSTETIEKQMIENRNEVIKLDTELARLRKDLRGTGDVGNQISTAIGNGFKNLRGQVAGFALSYVGFSALFNKITSEISQGIGEASKLEGVTAAFNNLNKPGLLDNLRQATRGTVSDLELMQRAVQASNFQIPLETLGSLLDFARRRAKDTGQEVNFLVDSIVTGIGRKSPLILDNLGISAVRLRQNLKGLSDESATVADVAAAVSKIIAEENAKAGKELDTTTERLAKNRAQWQNLRAEFTKNLLPALAAIGTAFLFLITNLPTIATIVGILAVGWGVANAQLVIQNAQLLLYNLLIIRNYIALGILSAAQLVYNSILFVFNGVLTAVTASLRLFGITAATATGPLGVILTIVGLLGAAFLGLSKAMGEAANKVEASTARFRAMNEVQKEANKISAEQIARINASIAVIKSEITSMDTKKRAIQDLIKENTRFSSVIKNNVIDLNELKKAYDDVTASIKLQAKAQASAKLTAEKRQKVDEVALIRQIIESGAAINNGVVDINELTDSQVQQLFNIPGVKRAAAAPRGDLQPIKTDASGKAISGQILVGLQRFDFPKLIEALSNEEQKKISAFQNFVMIQNNVDKELEAFLNSQKTNATLFEVDIKDLRAKLEKLDKDINDFQGDRVNLQKKIAERNRLQKQLDKLLGKKEPGGSDRGSRLTGEQKDAFKDIDALRDKEITDIKIRFQQRQIEEENYLLTVLRINRDAIDAKLKLLKGANAEERKQIAELNLERITQEQETNNKIFNIRAKALKEQLEQEIANIRLAAAVVENDPQASDTAKAQAKLDADNAILKLQEKFNADIDKLEKLLAQQSLTNTKESADEIRKTREEIFKDQVALGRAALQDINTAGEKHRAELNINYQKLRQAILNNDKLTASQRQKALEKLDKLHNKTIISSELAQLQIEFEKIKQLYEAGLASEEEFLKKKAELEKKKTDLDEANIDLSAVGIVLPSEAETQKLLAERLAKSFGFKEQSAEAQLLGEIISQTYDLASEAMNSYFDAERDRINENLQLELERLDMLKQQVIDRAQSQEEIESIEKQFAARKRKAEIQAGEQLKKTKRAEAKIALATELANIAASAASAGVFAPILFGILAGLALARHALRVAEINREKFKFGGEVKKKSHAPTERGGQAKGRSHAQGGIPFNYEAEDQELFIINKKSAIDNKIRTITGTNKQIASKINELGGGVSFAKGAKQTKFAAGGVIGDVLQPPVLTNASNIINNVNGIDAEKFDELIGVVREHQQATDERFDRLEVHVDSRQISKAQNKNKKQSDIGTL